MQHLVVETANPLGLQNDLRFDKTPSNEWVVNGAGKKGKELNVCDVMRVWSRLTFFTSLDLFGSALGKSLHVYGFQIVCEFQKIGDKKIKKLKRI